ncbi:MAG: acyl-ACP desaturase [Acidobacteria bacterium]|nr:MAG: acyl-ACP desaturase [Acidobacteriota bacterium]
MPASGSCRDPARRWPRRLSRTGWRSRSHNGWNPRRTSVSCDVNDARRAEVLRSIEPLVAGLARQHEAKAEEWWPSAELPRAYLPEDAGRLAEMQRRSKGIPPAVRACLALNIVTEEGLPLFHQALTNMLPAASAFLSWAHRWTAEEDRHGHVMRDYASLTGIVDEIALDRMQFAFLRNGWDDGWDGDPFRVFVYTSLQERATQIAHQQTAAIAGQYEPVLGGFLKTVARDEARHYAFYRAVFAGVLDADVDDALESAAAIMPLMAMPGGSMPQYRDLAETASRAGIYTLRHYHDLVQELIRFWAIGNRTPSTDRGRAARDRIMGIPARLTKIADRMEAARTARAFQFEVAFGHEFTL